MSFTVTAALAALFATLAVFCGWRGAQPLDVHKGPRLMPWRLLMLTFATGAILMVTHLLNLGGMTTGR